MDREMLVFAAVIVAVVVGFAVLSRFTPRGTVLIIGVLLYMVGRMVARSDLASARMIGGLCMGSGVAASLVGLVDLLRKRTPKQSPIITDEQYNAQRASSEQRDGEGPHT